jgi:hypothetical protein
VAGTEKSVPNMGIERAIGFLLSGILGRKTNNEQWIPV